jgi:hypothetical protein
VNLSKDDRALIRASAHGLDGPATDNLEAAVTARLVKLIESGIVTGIGRNHLRAAITAELAAGK